MANYDLYLQSSSTDAYYQASNGLQGNTDYAVGKDNSSITYKTAVRFPNVSAGQGISVNSAKLRLYVQFNLGTTGQIRFICTGIKEANTASFSSNPFSRPQTTSNVTLTKGVPNTGTTFDIDVTGIVTEILSQGTWASGNAMGFFVVDNGSDVGAYIEDDSLKAQLLIQLVAPGNFTPTPVTISSPTFPSSTDWGIRVSQPNVDVKTATESQLYFTSRKKELRISNQGQTTATQFAHGLSYAPGVLGYYTDANGRHIINYPFNVFSVGAAILSDSTNVYLSYQNSNPEYYYVFIDPLT